MSKLTASEKADLAFMSWRAFAEHLGLRLHGSSGPHSASLWLPSGNSWEVPEEARKAIEQALTKTAEATGE